MRKCVSFAILIALVAMIGLCRAEDAAAPDMAKYREVKVDTDNDGTMDGVDVYDEQGRLIRRGYDTDGDMTPDRWQSYDPNTGLPIVVPSDAADELL